MQLVSIDPGLREMGVAYWTSGKLDAVALLRGEQDTNIRDLEASRTMASEFDEWLLGVSGAQDLAELYLYDGEIAYEKMKHYSGKARKNVRVDDLFQLVGVSHACLSSYRNASVEPHLPETWTSGKPDDVRHKVIRRRLEADDDDEGEIMARCEHKLPNADVEHVLDAVGVGLYHQKRL